MKGQLPPFMVNKEASGGIPMKPESRPAANKSQKRIAKRGMRKSGR